MKKLQQLCSCSCIKLLCFSKSFSVQLGFLFKFLVSQVNPFWIQVCYFLFVSLVGYLALKVSKPRTDSFRPKDFDVFFTSVSAATVSSMSTVEMEVFSTTQLVVITILMLIGGEVFTSMLELQFMKSKIKKQEKNENLSSSSSTTDDLNHIENGKSVIIINNPDQTESMETEDLKYNSIKYLGYLVLGYLLVVHVLGSILISLYLSLVPSARDVLKNKGLQIQNFAVFTTVSTFSNCGFIPTNENMIVFKKNSGLLLLLIPQLLLGNTLFPSCLRLVIWVLERFTKRVEFSYMLRKSSTGEIGFAHLLPSLHSSLLVATVLGFIVVQVILFWCMEWHSEAMDGMNIYQKIVGGLFEAVNSRHGGETIVDLSIISPAILVLFTVMMYLPPYTCFLPVREEEQSLRSCRKNKKKRGWLVENLIFSQLSYLVIFVIFICITERKKMKEDPLNFSVLNIILEVISAYGNVGFTTGYSCKRQLNHSSYCKDTLFGFVGRWSIKGKFLLILVMFFGRLKKFMNIGGRAWKLS